MSLSSSMHGLLANLCSNMFQMVPRCSMKFQLGSNLFLEHLGHFGKNLEPENPPRRRTEGELPLAKSNGGKEKLVLPEGFVGPAFQGKIFRKRFLGGLGEQLHEQHPTNCSSLARRSHPRNEIRHLPSRPEVLWPNPFYLRQGSLEWEGERPIPRRGLLGFLERRIRQPPPPIGHLFSLLFSSLLFLLMFDPLSFLKIGEPIQ